MLKDIDVQLDTILTAPNGPGKTAPRLLTDLLSYNPVNDGRNVLSELPPHFGSEEVNTRPYKRGKHNHELIILHHNTQADNRSIFAGCQLQVATICTICRLYFDFRVLYPEDSDLRKCCPQEGYPLHHFRYEPLQSEPLNDPVNLPLSSEAPVRQDQRTLVCTSPACGVALKITTAAPRITEKYKHLLTNNSTLYQRKTRAVKENPETYGESIHVATPTPTRVLNTLRQYLKNVMTKPPKPIPWKNKTFMECLGDECLEMLRGLGWDYNETEECLEPPDLQSEESPVKRQLSLKYEDWLIELLILLDQFQASSAVDERFVQFQPVRAESDIRRLMACSEYETNTRKPYTIDLTKEEHPRYASLGAQSDFADKLLTWSYERQKACDPKNAPYYFECLADLAQGRRSEDLNMTVATLRSNGEYTAQEVNDAFKSLGLEPDKTDESLIIGVFKSRLADSPRQESQLRESLSIIGHALRSDEIQQVARKVIADIRQAYAKLGVQESTDKEFIIATYEVALADHPEDTATFREALKVIAENRHDNVLLSYVENGQIYEHPPTLDVAFQRLGIEDRSIIDEDLIAVYQLRLADTPSQISDLRAALKSIAKERKSSRIESFLQTGQDDTTSKGSKDWPVGLENIGNTCYLNSLLQFYFTIKPLRTHIMEYEQHQEDNLTDEVLERKRVGGRKLGKKEIERAKKFVCNLQELFNAMITTQDSSVTPKKELAYLALVPSREDVERTRRSMSLSASDAPSGMIGPMLPPHLSSPTRTQPLVAFNMDVDEPPTKLQVINEDEHATSTTSDETLVGDVLPSYEESAQDDLISFTNDKENRTPKRAKVHDDSTNLLLDDSEPLIPKDNQADVMMKDLTQNKSSPDLPATPDTMPSSDPLSPSLPAAPQPPPQLPPPPPNRPPPVPPRPVRRDSEIMIEAALKPESHEQDGEQVDIIKRLFYGKTKQYLELPESSPRHKEEYFSHLLVDVAEGNRDIYSAMDNIFDASLVDLEGHEARRFVTLSQVPPILQIQIQRVQFDRATGSAFKSNSMLKFSDTIYLDRYMESENNDLNSRREDSWKWKAELKTLLLRKTELTQTTDGVELAKVIDLTKQYLEDLNEADEGLSVDPVVLTGLEQRRNAIVREVQNIDERIKVLESQIAQQFTDLRKHGYRIHSVFIHRGSVSFGHYWIYIYDFKRRMYRKYNDGYVTEITDDSEVFNQGDGTPATPYFLVFVREDILDDLTESVCRVIGGDISQNSMVIDS